MFIKGLNKTIAAEIDAVQSELVMTYVIYYSRIIAFLGIIIVLLVGIDYFLDRDVQNDTVVLKYREVINNEFAYNIVTETYSFKTTQEIYDKTSVTMSIDICKTRLLKSSTFVIIRIDNGAFLSWQVENIYLIPFVMIYILTLVLSVMFILKTRNHRKISYNENVLNLGIINSILCIITLGLILFPKI
jgi:hypothetical protein